jgi:N-acetylglucosamine-6-sulfatase
MRRARSPGCPSRSETVTGRYLHNVHTPPVEKQCNESYSGQDDAGNTCCMHVDEVLVNNYTMAKYMKEQKGYTSGMFGKYLNNCPDTAQPGWDAWFANGGGDCKRVTSAGAQPCLLALHCL